MFPIKTSISSFTVIISEIRVVIYAFFEMFGSADFRKESLFFQKPTDPFPDLMLAPTYLQWQVNLGAEDYGLKEWRIFKSEKVQQPSFYCDAFLYA
jgi:hypothetical protein